jgi:hypothetical protein
VVHARSQHPKVDPGRSIEWSADYIAHKLSLAASRVQSILNAEALLEASNDLDDVEEKYRGAANGSCLKRLRQPAKRIRTNGLGQDEEVGPSGQIPNLRPERPSGESWTMSGLCRSSSARCGANFHVGARGPRRRRRPPCRTGVVAGDRRFSVSVEGAPSAV